MRSSDAARKRAPKSLKAAVGPWNSSSTRQRTGGRRHVDQRRREIEGVAHDRRQLCRQRIARGERLQQDLRHLRRSCWRRRTRRAECAARPSARTARRPARGRAQWPRSGRRDGSHPACSGTAPVSPLPRARRRDRSPTIQSSVASPCCAKACTMAALTRSASASSSPGEHRRPGAGDRAAERAGRERGLLHGGKPGNQHLALRLDHDIEQRLADQRRCRCVKQPEMKPGEVRRLPDRNPTGHGLAQDRPRLARGQHHVRMHEHAADATRAPGSA